MTKLFRNAMTAGVLVAVLTMASTPAYAEFLDFEVDESTIPGAFDVPVFIADQLAGAYTELIIIGAGTFDAYAFANFTAYRANEGNDPVGSQITNPCTDGSPLCAIMNDPTFPLYTMYATFVASGSFTTVGDVTTFTGGSASVALFVDPNQDTTGTPGAPFTLAGTADDYMVLFADTLEFGKGVLDPPLLGAFDLLFSDPTLTSTGVPAGIICPLCGTSLYPSLVGLVFKAEVDGDFDIFPVTPGEHIVTGQLSAQFIPEPATLTLFGLGLLGSGYAVRRRRRAQQ